MSVALRSSVTRRRTVCGPAVGKDFVTVDVVPLSNVPLLSRSQAKALIVPSGSVDVDLKVTRWPGMGAAGEKVNDATGGWLGTTVTVFVLVPVSSRLLVTVRVTTLSPALLKVVDTLWPVLVTPPRFQDSVVIVPALSVAPDVK